MAAPAWRRLCRLDRPPHSSTRTALGPYFPRDPAGTPVASAPPRPRPARSHRPTHRDPRDVLLALVGHGCCCVGCRGCLPRCYCCCSCVWLSAQRPRSGGANGALAGAAASSRLRPPPGLPRRLPETIVNLPGLPSPRPAPGHSHPPPLVFTPGLGFLFCFFFCGASWDPVRQEWLI